MNKNKSIILMCTGALLLLLAGGLAAYYSYLDSAAQKSSRLILDEVRAQIPSNISDASSVSAEPPSAPDLAKIPTDDEFNMLIEYNPIGILEIPKINVALPVLSECTDALLNVSVCRYTGNDKGKPERLVIAGHNYKSQFKDLPHLAVGDELMYTDIDGMQYLYSVSGFEEIGGSDFDGLNQGDWDITLFTCNLSGSKRYLVRLKATE